MVYEVNFREGYKIGTVELILNCTTIQNQCIEEMPTTGYKIARNGDKRVLVTLTIPDGTMTNMSRPGVKNSLYAKFRAQQAYVERIEDDFGRTYEHAFPSIYLNNNFVYRRGEMVQIPFADYDTSNSICKPGIHYFLSASAARLYNISIGEVQNGLYCEWDENGGEIFRCTIEKRPDTGIWYQKADKGGMIRRKSGGYVGKAGNGRIVKEYWPDYGYFRYYETSGALMIDAEVCGGKFHGKYQHMYEDGKIAEIRTYNNGKLHGVAQTFYANGRLASETLYRDGVFTGQQITYSMDGKR